MHARCRRRQGRVMRDENDRSSSARRGDRVQQRRRSRRPWSSRGSRSARRPAAPCGPVRECPRDRHPLLLAAGELRRQVVGAVGTGRPPRAARRRAWADARPCGRPSAAWMLARGQRRDQVELLEDEADRAPRRRRESRPAAALRVAALEAAHAPRGGTVERAGAEAAWSCRGPLAPTMATTSPGAISRSMSRQRRDPAVAGAVAPADRLELIDGCGRAMCDCPFVSS